MASINVSIDELLEMSKAFNALSEKYFTNSMELRNLIEKLSKSWIGAEFDDMIADLKLTAEISENVVSTLTNVQVCLDTAAVAYKDSEAQMVNAILNTDII